MTDAYVCSQPGAYVKASNDGFNWVTIASWDVHPGTSSLSDGVRPFLYHQSRAHPYNTIAGVEGGLDTWGIDLPGTTGYKFWRIGGGGSSSVGGDALILACNPGAGRLMMTWAVAAASIFWATCA